MVGNKTTRLSREETRTTYPHACGGKERVLSPTEFLNLHRGHSKKLKRYSQSKGPV